MKKLNNKGYMLVEIILAVGLAMAVGYFLIELTLKVKNTNDDLLVESLVKTDQGIIYNMIMKDVYNNSSISKSTVNDRIKTNKDVKNQVIYTDSAGKEHVIIVSDYATVGTNKITGNKVIIPISVKQMPDENFDVIIYFAE